MTRREDILACVADLAINFLVYDRKHDEELEVGDIEEAVADGALTLDEICAEFRRRLLEFGQWDD